MVREIHVSEAKKVNGTKRLWIWGIAILLCGATGAFADTFTLTGVAPGMPSLGGVYTSPYTATISGQTGIQVICDDFNDEVFFNESWTVTATSITQLPLLGASSPVLWDTGSGSIPGTPANQVTDYVTAAILSAELLSISPSTQEAEDLSYAIWDVFTPGASSGLSATDQNLITGVGGYLPTAQALAVADLKAAGGNIAAALQLDNITNVTIYTANPKTGGAVTYCPPGDTCGAPQEFLVVSMAEPPSPALLAIDLLAVLGLVLFVRRRLVRAAN